MKTLAEIKEFYEKKYNTTVKLIEEKQHWSDKKFFKFIKYDCFDYAYEEIFHITTDERFFAYIKESTLEFETEKILINTKKRLEEYIKKWRLQSDSASIIFSRKDMK